MVDTPVLQSEHLPPGTTGQRKQDFAVETGLAEFAAVAAKEAGKIKDLIFDMETKGKVTEWVGFVRGVKLENANRIRNNPGATQEEIDKWAADDFTRIAKEGAKAKGRSRVEIARRFKAGKAELAESFDAAADTVRLNRALQQFNADLEAAAQRGDVKETARLIKDSQYIADELKDVVLRARITPIRDNEVLREATAIASVKGEAEALEAIDKINATTKELYGVDNLYGPDEIAALKERFTLGQKQAANIANAQLETAQAETYNEAFAMATGKVDANGIRQPGDLAGAYELILNAPFDAEWKGPLLTKLETAVDKISEDKPSPFDEDGDPSKEGELSSMVHRRDGTPAEIKAEIEHWHGRTDGISTSTYERLMGKQKQMETKPEQVTSKGLAQRYKDLETMRGRILGTTTTPAGIAKAADLEERGLSAITSMQYHEGTTMLDEIVRRDPTIIHDSRRLQEAWETEVLPAMFGAPDPETGETWWDRVWNRLNTAYLRSNPALFPYRAIADVGRRLRPTKAKGETAEDVSGMTMEQLLAERERLANANP